MLMEGQAKFFSPQISAGVSQEKGVAVISQTTEANGDKYSNVWSMRSSGRQDKQELEISADLWLHAKMLSLLPAADTRLALQLIQQILRTLVGLASRLTPHQCTWTQLPSQELQATVNSEAKNMTSVTFLKITWHAEASGHYPFNVQTQEFSSSTESCADPEATVGPCHQIHPRMWSRAIMPVCPKLNYWIAIGLLIG